MTYVVTLLGVLGVCVVLFAAAVVAVRDEPVLVPAERDRADVLPASGPLYAGDLHRVRFAMALRGYRMDEVDEVLDRAADELRARDERVRVLEGELARERAGGDAPDEEPDREQLPDVEVLPGAAPPEPVPFPSPVRTDEPVRLPSAPDADPDAAPTAAPVHVPTAPSPTPGR